MVGVKRRVTGHEVVESGRGDERGDEPDEVVVHVARVAQGRRRRRHDRRDELVDLSEGGVFDVQAFAGDAIQRRVVEDDHAIRVLRQTLQRQDRVVRLHHHVGNFVLCKRALYRLYCMYSAVSLRWAFSVRALSPKPGTTTLLPREPKRNIMIVGRRIGQK